MRQLEEAVTVHPGDADFLYTAAYALATGSARKRAVAAVPGSLALMEPYGGPRWTSGPAGLARTGGSKGRKAKAARNRLQ